MKKFNNVPNKSYNFQGKIIWESRSCAVVCVIIAKKENEHYVLIDKRGIGVDNSGKWCLVCGYFDFNENHYQAVERECHEETGLDIEEILKTKTIIKNDLDHPFYVNTDPSENRQNITLSYGLVFETDEFPKTTTEYAEKDEVDDIEWVNVKDIEKYNFAFNHENRIKMYCKNSNIEC